MTILENFGLDGTLMEVLAELEEWVCYLYVNVLVNTHT